MHNDLPLLISSPDTGGGVAILENGALTQFRIGGATALFVSPVSVAVGIQPQKVYALHDGRPLSFNLGRHADIHDVLIKGDSLYAVLTGRNGIIEIDLRSHTIVNTWIFEGHRDAWHINCLGEIGGRLCFSAFGKFLDHRGYKHARNGDGFVADLHTGKIVVDNLSNPHSILTEDGTTWLCNSLLREVQKISGGKRTASPDLGGYTRGLCVIGESLFAGVSAARGKKDAGTAGIAELNKHTLELVRTTPVPYREIYDIRAISAESERRNVRQVLENIPPVRQGLRRKLSNSIFGLRLAPGQRVRQLRSF